MEEIESVAEKVIRRTSFGKAVIAPLPHVREATSSGLSKEHSEQGRVKKEVYYQYLQSASRTGCFFFLLATIMGQAMSVMSTYTLRLWSESNRESGVNAGLRDPYLLGYGFFNLMSIVSAATAGLLIWVLCSLRSSKYLHDSVRSSRFVMEGFTNYARQMLESVMKAPLSFFETTPTGRYYDLPICLGHTLTEGRRILNLFSRDVYVVDLILARVST